MNPLWWLAVFAIPIVFCCWEGRQVYVPSDSDDDSDDMRANEQGGYHHVVEEGEEEEDEEEKWVFAEV